MPASACAESEGRMRPMIDEQEFRKLADDALNALNRNLIALDRKSTRLNSSHLVISYAVFCLKKKNALRSYVRGMDRIRRAAERRKANDSHADCYRFFRVPERGTAVVGRHYPA